MHCLITLLRMAGCQHNRREQIRVDWICKAWSELILINTPRNPSQMQFLKWHAACERPTAVNV